MSCYCCSLHGNTIYISKTWYQIDFTLTNKARQPHVASRLKQGSNCTKSVIATDEGLEQAGIVLELVLHHS